MGSSKPWLTELTNSSGTPRVPASALIISLGWGPISSKTGLCHPLRLGDPRTRLALPPLQARSLQNQLGSASSLRPGRSTGLAGPL